MNQHAISEPDARTARREAERQASAHRRQVNRQNAQHSTGPKTAQGKARSSRNSFRHGHYSSQTVLEGEPVADYQDLREDLLAQYEPVGHTESALLEELAQSRWRVLRFRRHEARIMEGSERVYDEPETLFTIYRLMTGAERAFYRALRELERLQLLRLQAEQENPSEIVDEETTYTENGFVPQISADSVTTPSSSVHPPEPVAS